MVSDIVVAVRERTDVAEARRHAGQLAGFGERFAGALNIVVVEAASNLIKHAGGGEIIAHRTGPPGSAVEVMAIDNGPGIADLTRSFEDGYSTAGSPGTGLGAISRAASFCDAYSGPQKGLVVMARVGPPADGVNSGLEIGAICAPYPGESVSGDCWALEAGPSSFRIALGDGLGHGSLAAAAADAGIETAMNPSYPSPVDALKAAHGSLRATRGAAMSVADVNLESGVVSFAGVGNVSGAIVQNDGTRRQMIGVNGTLGHELRTPRQYQYPLPPDSLVILHSDGLSTNWSLEKYPGLFRHHPAVIAATIFRDFRRHRDDATVLVVRLKDSLR